MTHRNPKFIIPHAINKGYPFSGMPSKVATPVRMEVFLDTQINKVGFTLKEDQFDVKEVLDHLVENSGKTPLEDFLLARLYEVTEALTLAENQVSDILEEHPFVPEDFGFDLAHKQKSVADPPSRIYVSKYSPVAIFRKPGTPGDESWNPNKWTVQIFGENKEPIHEDNVLLPCHRIAYAYFYAKGIRVEEPSVINLEESQPTAQ